MRVSLPVVATVVAALAFTPREVHCSPNATSGISLELFNQVMATEVRTEFGLSNNVHDDAAAEAMWTDAILYEWDVVEEREEDAANDVRRSTVGLVPPGLSPFLVCDTTYGKSGDACVESVAEALGSDSNLMVSKKETQQ